MKILIVLISVISLVAYTCCQDLPIDMLVNPDGQSFDIVIDYMPADSIAVVGVSYKNNAWKIEAVDSPTISRYHNNGYNDWWLEQFCEKRGFKKDQITSHFDYELNKMIEEFKLSPFNNSDIFHTKISKDRVVGLVCLGMISLYGGYFVGKCIYRFIKKLHFEIMQKSVATKGDQ